MVVALAQLLLVEAAEILRSPQAVLGMECPLPNSPHPPLLRPRRKLRLLILPMILLLLTPARTHLPTT